MVYKLKRLFLDVMFELYGMLHKWLTNRARECLEVGETKAFHYWARKAEKCIDKREDILERLFT